VLPTLVVALLSLGIASVFQAAARIAFGSFSLSPDGRRYLAMAAEHCAPLPFALRWLLPWACGPWPKRWYYCTVAHLTLLVPIVAVWLTHWIDQPVSCVAGALLLVGLPGIWHLHIRWPVLVDPTAMTWAMASALCAVNGYWIAAVLCSLVAGAVKESGPIFAAVYGWNPIALVGLLAPLVRRYVARLAKDPEGEDDILVHPVRAARRAHRGDWWRPRVMLAPWGICLLAPFTFDLRLSLMLAAGACLAYGQLLVAVDTVRLYQWAAPLAVLATAAALPPWALLAGLVAHLLNPWAGDGR